MIRFARGIEWSHVIFTLGFFLKDPNFSTLWTHKNLSQKKTRTFNFFKQRLSVNFFYQFFSFPLRRMYFPTAGIDLESEKPLWRCGITWGLKTRIPLNDGENSGEHFDAKRFFKGLVCVCLLICWLHFG